MASYPKLSEAQPFTFHELKNAPSLKAHGATSEFQMSELQGVPFQNHSISADTIRQEREVESKTQFRVDEKVRQLRGLSQQEKSDFNNQLQKEIEARSKSEMAKAFELGYQEGLKKGQALGQNSKMAELTPVIEEFTQRLKSTHEQMQQLLVENKSQMYEVLKRTLKWLVLKEIQDEGYLPRVMEKLILELNQKQNLIIKVQSSDLAPVKDMIAELEKKVGELTNVRLEPSLEMQGRGVIIETENSLLDASPEALFLTLDKLFEQALGHESKT